jgi:nucleotide-binding universal stress UspA family protein
MLNRILVPTDFSEVATNAIDFALNLCVKTGAQLHVIHVNPVPVADINFPQETYQLYMDELNKEAAEKIESLKKEVLLPSNVKFVTDTMMGFITDEINQYSKQNGIDLIVMGTTGASGIQELLIGSNTASLVAKSTIPVFVIPPGAKHDHFKHILYSSDYSEPEFPQISRLIYFAELYDAVITVIHTKSESDRYFNIEDNFFVKNKANIAHEKITVEPVQSGDITDAINEYIDKKGVDMVVMAKHNRNWFDRIFHRSMSKRMSYHTRVPLLVLNK